SRIDAKVADLRRNMVTTQDVAALRREQVSIGKLADLRSELVGRLDALDTEMRSRFDRVETQLNDLEEDLTAHMKRHRKLEEDIRYLKGRPARTAARAPRRRVEK